MDIKITPYVFDKYEDLSFAFFALPLPEPYSTESEIASVEARITSGVRSRAPADGNWESLSQSQAFIEFYNSMGINGRKCSNPVKQASRFSVNDYKTKGPLIDKVMEIEYEFYISSQLYDFNVLGSDILLDIAQNALSITDYKMSKHNCKVGELVTLRGDGTLVHCPSVGNAGGFTLTADSSSALLRLMKPPGVQAEAMKLAIDKVWRLLTPICATYLSRICTVGNLQIHAGN